jgi:methionyl-tRNA formyltransferase
MRIVFMGTPDFAVPTLETLLKSEHEVVGVVTQPDKPRGRSGKLVPSPVKETALQGQIPVFQPERVKEESFFPVLEELHPDVIVVVAFGQILPKCILELPKYGCMNVHASLLPKLRGAAPIQWSVIDGDKESGVTIQQMDEGLDTGDILLVEKYTLDEKETGGSLFDKLSLLGGPLILQALTLAEQGKLSPVPQNHEEHTYAKMLTKAMGEISFEQSAVVIERLIRGLNPWPSAYTHLDNKLLKIWDADVVESQGDFVPGQVSSVQKNSFTVRTGQGDLQIHSLQLEGKKRMDAESFLRGFPLKTGQQLG